MNKKFILLKTAKTTVILVFVALPGLKIIANALTKDTAYQFMVNNKK